MKKHSKKKMKKRLKKARKKTFRQQLPSEDVMYKPEMHSIEVHPPAMELADQEMVPVLEGYDESTLARAKTHWFFGEWHQLAALDMESLRARPDRDRFALLIASAHQQLGKHEKARKYTRIALDWGCPHQIVAQVLIAGVHNTLGKAAVLMQDESRIAKHFKASVAAIDTRDTALVSHARSVREMVRMGMLPQAVVHLEDLAEKPQTPNIRHMHANAHAKVITMEIDWLRDKVHNQLKQQNIAINRERREFNKADKHKSSHSLLKSNHYYGLHDLDKKLEAYLNYDEGYFVELGANDGITQSNTFYFEKERKWRGILIEPILHNFLKCKHNRSPENSLVCAACVSFDYEDPYVMLAYSNLMTSTLGLESDIDDPIEHAHTGSVFLDKDEDVVEVMAAAKTLNTILDSEHAPENIDLLSLDVEGAEIAVLKGIDHKKYHFKYMLIESRDHEKIKAYLAQFGYSLVDKLSQHDYLFSITDS